MSNPFQGFQQGLMTGANLGQGMYRARGDRQVGAALASGNLTGAAASAYGQGDLQTGQALDTQARQQAERKRGLQQTDALRTGDYDGAMSFAQSPEEMAQITQFRNSASEAERAQAAQQSEQLAMVVGSIESLPADQQFAAAQEAAQRMGMDPASITPDMVTPEGLAGLRMRAMGLANYLKFQQDQRDAMSPRYVPALGGFIMPPGSPGMGQPETLDALPQGARIRPRPNQPSPATAAGGGERSQTPRVSFRSSQEAQAAITSLVPGVRVTSGARSPADNRRVGGAAGSFHLQDRARDLVPPPGMSMAQLAAKMRQAGFRALNEGDHIHVSW